MKNCLLLFLLLLTFNFSVQGQTLLYDFESPETSTALQHFGGSVEGVLTNAIDNPDPSGLNTSSKVIELVKAGDAPVWGGAFTNPSPANGVDATNGGQVCIDVWMDHMGTISLKLETADPNDPGNWIQTVAVPAMNQWETLCFDLGMNSLEGDMSPATGTQFVQVVFFADFGNEGTGTNVTSYLDNIVVPESETGGDDCVVMFDYDNTAAYFSYFGSNQEGGTTQVIFNPNQSGINASDSVMHYIKGGDAQTWAGAVISPDLTEQIDGSIVQEICIKAHWPAAGNLTLKLELAAFDNPDNWINTQPVDISNEWTEICFDLSVPSFEGNMGTAAGFVYPKIVLFPDFGIAGTGMEVDYYMDDITICSSNEISNYDVTLSVDMNNYPDPFTQVYVSGTFNGWSGDSNPLDDSDGDGIWTTTINVVQGFMEYKFTLDNWTVQEIFDGNDVCTISTDDGMGTINTNRALNVTDNVDLGAVCFNSCYACGESVRITWNVNMSEQTVSEDGVYLAGGPFFGHGEYEMTDPDGDQFYSITLEREIGFNSDYTFINGICLPDWSCKENIAGQDCAVAPFNDRNLAAVMADTEITTCFGQCSDDGSCEASEMFNVTFNVDMNNVVAASNIFIAGNTINNWDPTVTEMLDPESDGSYTVTVSLFPGAHEYKFVNGMDFEVLAQGDDCTITDPSGEFTNRLLLLGSADTVINLVSFTSCDLLVNSNDLVVDNNLATIQPTLVNDQFNILFKEIKEHQNVRIYNVQGQLNFEQKFNFVERQQINTADLPKGIYFVQINIDGRMMTQKIVIQ